MNSKTIPITFSASQSSGTVSGILIIRDGAKAIYVFAHGAGAGMEHMFMNKAAEFLAVEGIGTFRFNFPYTEKKLKRIDPQNILTATICSAVNKAKEYSGNLPLFAGGKSMGGRMTSLAASENKLDNVNGLIFFGFPLHAPGKESIERAAHLSKVKQPMLFLQGTRDKLANPDLIKPVISKLGKKAALHMIEGADHSFHMLKKSGRDDDDILNELARAVSEWITR